MQSLFVINKMCDDTHVIHILHWSPCVDSQTNSLTIQQFFNHIFTFLYDLIQFLFKAVCDDNLNLDSKLATYSMNSSYFTSLKGNLHIKNLTVDILSFSTSYFTSGLYILFSDPHPSQHQMLDFFEFLWESFTFGSSVAWDRVSFLQLQLYSLAQQLHQVFELSRLIDYIQ